MNNKLIFVMISKFYLEIVSKENVQELVLLLLLGGYYA